MALRVREMRQAAFHHVVMDEGGVEVGAYPLQHDTQKVIVGLQYALRIDITLHVPYSRYRLQYLDEGVAHLNGVLLGALQGKEVGDGDVASEAHHLVTDGVFEAQHDADGHDHDRQADGDANGGNADGRLRHFPCLVSSVVYLSGNEKRIVHALCRGMGRDER